MNINCLITLSDQKKNKINCMTSITVVKVGYMIDSSRVILPYIEFNPPLIYNGLSAEDILVIDRLIFNDFENVYKEISSMKTEHDNIIFTVGDKLNLIIKNGQAQISFDIDQLSNLDNECVLLLPEECPFCGRTISWGEKQLSKKIENGFYVPSCENIGCPAFIHSNTQIFLDAIGFNQGVYRFIINKLILRNIIKNPLDIFNLSYKHIKELDLNFKIDINTFLNHITELKMNLDLSKILKGLFFKELNEKYIQQLVDNYKTFSNLISQLNVLLDTNENNKLYPNFLVDMLFSKFIINGIIYPEFEILLNIK